MARLPTRVPLPAPSLLLVLIVLLPVPALVRLSVPVTDVSAVPVLTAAAAVTGSRWVLPVPDHVDVARAFDPPATPYGRGHRGVDLVADQGRTVLAAGPGVVVWSGDLAGRGVVSIDHGGLRTTYEPLDVGVSRGSTVAAGDPLGILAAGHAGCPRPACLHWGARIGETYVDPLSLLSGPVRLLPRGRDGRGR